MIAPFVLLYFCSASRTERNTTMLLNPAFKFVIHVLLTSIRTVPFISALEAYISLANWARDLLRIQIVAPHRPCTPWFSAPPHQRIPLDFLLGNEFFILLKCLGLYSLKKFFYLIFRNLFKAFELKTNQVVYLCPLNLQLEQFTWTVNAKAVAAFEAPSYKVVYGFWSEDDFIGITDSTSCLFFRAWSNFFDDFILLGW